MDKGDIATWFADVVAIGAFVQSWWGTRIAKRAQTFGERQYEEAQEKEDREARQVRWEIDRPNKMKLVLRNVSQNHATGVTIDDDQFGGFGRDIPRGVDVPPNGSVEFMILTANGVQFPNEVWITWNGQDEPVAVPVPSWM